MNVKENHWSQPMSSFKTFEKHKEEINTKMEEKEKSTFAEQIKAIDNELNRLQGIVPHVEMKITRSEMVKQLEEARQTIEDIRRSETKNNELQSNRLTKSEVTLNKSKRDFEKYTRSLEKNSEELNSIAIGLEELEGKNSVMVAETEAMRERKLLKVVGMNVLNLKN
ncbi:uncharacterized protein MELLADRAFT_69834 [Melampsora larici-populina 98AG31]|uniref:Uncharacterized protein n=1 Tax=Melampsora larici-populina (strain 98AG31 / pathotype 3-4-7) TaxID=747676 RepID=F4SCE1_MELLP|nr:uncharacterized protein MELLADRAFT_69834 [Melampsora larici-populina 98AG31]EGF97680.1 hypothetical protein MELLADRAFT_69834 [Melampsora larici-populina 98AG31]